MTSSSERLISITVRAPSEDDRERLDRFLAGHRDVGLTRNRIQKLIADGLVLVNGMKSSKKYEVKEGDVVTLTVPPPRPAGVDPEDIPLDIVYQDEHLAVVNKPAGLVTHPGAGNYTGTLVNALVYRFKSLAEGSSVERPGIVHRLDKNTSGLLIVARGEEAYQKLQRQLHAREIHRRYLALVCGSLKEPKGTVAAPIGRSTRNRKKMTVTTVNSREAVTDYEVIERFRAYDLVRVSLGTGRTHQIRVHLAHLGHPVFGDPDYGGREKRLRGMFAPERPLARKLLQVMPRQALHASELEFTHPISKRSLALKSSLPEDFQSVLEILHREGGGAGSIQV